MGLESINEMRIYQWMGVNQSVEINQWGGKQSMGWESINGGMNQWGGNQSMGWKSIDEMRIYQ